MSFPVAEEYIVAAERALGRRLPEPLRQRLAQANGGEVEALGDDWELNPIRDTSDRKRLARSVNDIVTETVICRGWPRFPPGAIAIASNGGGDLLLLVPGFDEILCWEHETGALNHARISWD